MALALGVAGCGDDDVGPLDARVPDAPHDASERDAPDGEVEPPPRYLRFVRVMMEGEPAQITDFAFVPGADGAPTDELLATTRDGRLLHYELADGRATMRGELAIPGVFVNLDCGLISLTFAPDFVESGHVYLGQCFSRYQSGVVRVRFAPPRYELAPDDVVEVLRYGDGEATHPWHNVGSLGFDGDVLWALFGDKTRPLTAEDPADPLGSIIRVVPRADGGYDPAPDNPRALGDARFHPDVYAYGLRSPWKGVLSEGRFYLGDVGNFRVEEVNVVDRAGAFLGWPRAEGPCGEGCADIPDPVVDPVVHWTHRADHPYLADDPFAIARTGRVAYVGLRYPAVDDDDPYRGVLDGAVLYGDACVGFVRALEVDDSGALVRDEGVGHLVGASGWQIGADGHVYATSFGRCTSVRDAVYLPGGFWRAELAERPTDVGRVEGFPDRLSEYGLFPEAPVLDNVPTGALPFEPAFPMWTNGMGKLRHVVLDAGGELRRVGDEYVAPEGALFFKTFLADAPEGSSGHPVETRVIRVGEEGALEYAAYLWNAEGTDAERLDLRTPEPVDVRVLGEALTHEVPSRIQCVACHEAGARRILGFTPLQIDDGLADVEDDALREVLGWAYGNCAHCHDGSGGPDASFSMLPDVFLDNTLDHPTEGSASGVGVRVVPGDPDASALVIALSGGDDASGLRPMPPLGVQRRDDEALERLRAWIAALP